MSCVWNPILVPCVGTPCLEPCTGALCWNPIFGTLCWCQCLEPHVWNPVLVLMWVPQVGALCLEPHVWSPMLVPVFQPMDSLCSCPMLELHAGTSCLDPPDGALCGFPELVPHSDACVWNPAFGAPCWCPVFGALCWCPCLELHLCNSVLVPGV